MSKINLRKASGKLLLVQRGVCKKYTWKSHRWWCEFKENINSSTVKYCCCTQSSVSSIPGAIFWFYLVYCEPTLQLPCQGHLGDELPGASCSQKRVNAQLHSGLWVSSAGVSPLGYHGSSNKLRVNMERILFLVQNRIMLGKHPTCAAHSSKREG